MFVFTACSTANKYIVPTTSEPLGAQELAQAQAEKMEIPPLPGDTGPYRIGPGDVLLVRDLNHPDLFVGERRAETLGMNLFTVQDDGFLALPFVGLVRVEEKTPHDLLSELNDAYRVFIREPNLSVTVFKYSSRKIYVLGQVKIPGAYPFDGRMTVLDGIGQAKGLNEKADLTGSYMVRGNNLLPVDLYALLRKGNLRHNISLADGDVIHIADLSDRRVYVLGEVRRPGVFPMGSDPLRLVDAISMAGGLNPVTAKKGNILLVRGGYADPVVYRLDLADVMNVAGGETFLEPGDRVYATPTGLATWSRTMLQLLPFLQGADTTLDIKNELE